MAEKMSKILMILLMCCWITLNISLHVSADYNNQQKWPKQQCLSGRAQSPINIPPTSSLCSYIKFTIQSPKTTIAFDPSKLQKQHLKIDYTGSTITVGNNSKTTDYKSLQFHFHIPSEHNLLQRSFDGEIHIVHADSNNNLAVFGIFIQPSVGNFSDFLDGWKVDSQQSSSITLPEISTPSHVFHYRGSLTTPNCTQGVQWFVSSEPLKVKRSNFLRLKKALNEGKPSNRKLQPLNERQVVDVGKGCTVRKSH